MGAFRDLIDSALGERTAGYKQALKQRQTTGRLTTGGTGYSDKQTRALQFAQDVARGFSAKALGDAMANGTPKAATAANVANVASNAVASNSNYATLDSLDKAQRRSEGLRVDEENKRRAEQYENFANALEGIAGSVQQGIQQGYNQNQQKKEQNTSVNSQNKPGSVNYGFEATYGD